jgi:hypothetical protein
MNSTIPCYCNQIPTFTSVSRNWGNGNDPKHGHWNVFDNIIMIFSETKNYQNKNVKFTKKRQNTA